MKYFDLPRDYTMSQLYTQYKQAIKKYHPNKTRTSSHLYKINSLFYEKKIKIKYRDNYYNFVSYDELERNLCQCGHYYDRRMICGDFLECEWCSIKVRIYGREKLPE